MPADPDPLERIRLDHLLRRFPLALALLEPGGALRWRNDRFADLFGPGNALLDALPDAAECAVPRKTTLANRRGESVEVLVHRVSAAGACLLVVDDTPGQVDAGTLRQMHVRLAQLERESLTDRLTGAWNRRYLELLMASELSRARRYRQPLSAILLDVDHFKRINDTFGHQAGDEVLRTLAALIRARIRAADALVRWGGEEFLLLMPYTSHRKAVEAAEELRGEVAAHAFPGGRRVTVSLGVVEYLPPEDADGLFARADRALYRAKLGGRDRVATDARGASDSWVAMRTPSPVQLIWHESYACGEPTIDREHEDLFGLANEAIEACLGRPADPAGFRASLERLVEHVARHFENEERILAAHRYGGLAKHLELHRALLERAQAISQAAQRGEAEFGALVEYLVHEVVAQHLLVADREFFGLFRRKAAAGS
jgi:diguanylate cyclase (GGDEF)-like protein/hemerythrin-like metal-binding protein